MCPTWWPPCAIYVAHSVQCCKVWLTTTTRVPCSNTAKTQNLFKFAGVPQTPKPISTVSGPKFTILRGHVEEVLLFNKFVSRLLIHACEDIAWQSWAMVRRWPILGNFLRPIFSASRMQHVWDLHPKFALRPHHVCKYGRHPTCNGWD